MDTTVRGSEHWSHIAATEALVTTDAFKTPAAKRAGTASHEARQPPSVKVQTAILAHTRDTPHYSRNQPSNAKNELVRSAHLPLKEGVVASASKWK